MARAPRAGRAGSAGRRRASSGASRSWSCCATPTSGRVRDRRAHLATVFGDPGVGKSRLVEEFTAGVERATVAHRSRAAVRRGRRVLADRVDGQGVGRNHRRRPCRGGVREAPASAARARPSRICSASHSVCSAPPRTSRPARRLVGRAPLGRAARRRAAARARLRGRAVGRRAHARRDRAPRALAARRPGADRLRRRGSSCSRCGRPGAAATRARRAIELAPLSDRRERASSPTRCSPADETPPAQRALVLEKAEGNPLFLEETARMLLEADGDGVPSGSPTACRR